MNRSIIGFAVAAALAGSSALAGPEYPPGLFENSPVVPSGPPTSAASEPPDAVDSPNVDPSPDDDCAGVAFRTYRSLEEVRQAHARCDNR
jgi:hypothetical protein